MLELAKRDTILAAMSKRPRGELLHAQLSRLQQQQLADLEPSATNEDG